MDLCWRVPESRDWPIDVIDPFRLECGIDPANAGNETMTGSVEAEFVVNVEAERPGGTADECWDDGGGA